MSEQLVDVMPFSMAGCCGYGQSRMLRISWNRIERLTAHSGRLARLCLAASPRIARLCEAANGAVARAARVMEEPEKCIMVMTENVTTDFEINTR